MKKNKTPKTKKKLTVDSQKVRPLTDAQTDEVAGGWGCGGTMNTGPTHLGLG